MAIIHQRGFPRTTVVRSWTNLDKRSLGNNLLYTRPPGSGSSGSRTKDKVRKKTRFIGDSVGCCCRRLGITVYHLPSKGKGVPITSSHTLGPENRGGDVRRHGPDIDLTPPGFGLTSPRGYRRVISSRLDGVDDERVTIRLRQVFVEWMTWHQEWIERSC